MKFRFTLICSFLIFYSASAQMTQPPPQSLDSLKKEIVQLNNKMNHMQSSLERAGKKTTNGIIVSIIGYSVTIAGGLILSENKDLGNALLVTGGAIGVTGTVILINGFKDIRLAGQSP